MTEADIGRLRISFLRNQVVRSSDKKCAIHFQRKGNKTSYAKFGQCWAFFFSNEYLQMIQFRNALYSLLSIQSVLHSGGFLNIDQVVVDHVLYLVLQS